MKRSYEKILFNLIRGMFLCLFIPILGFLILLPDRIDYVTKTSFRFPNYALLLCTLFFILIGMAVVTRLNAYASGIKVSINIEKIVVWISVILFILRIYICFNIYFYSTQWDVGRIYEVAKAFALGDIAAARNGSMYFSVYPNNILITLVLSWVLRFHYAFGVFSASYELMPMIILNSFINALAGWMTYRIVSRNLSEIWGFICFVICMFHIGLSPWTEVVYSDSLGLIFPVLVLWLYNWKSDLQGIRLAKWAMIVFFSCVGYMIKPTCLILLIAIILIEALCRIEKNWKKGLIFSLAIIFLSAGTMYLTQQVVKTIAADKGMILNEDAEFQMPHFLMMGLSDNTDGVYDDSDVEFSAQIESVKERNKLNLKIAEQRIRDYGFIGLGKHITKKMLVVFNDGSFAWGKEGGFYNHVSEEPNRKAAPFLRQIIYDDGIYHGYFLIWFQFIWIFVLFMNLFGCGWLKSPDSNNAKSQYHLKDDRDESRWIAVVQLTLIGLVMYEILFEARARYLYIYAPFFYIMATAGMRKLYFWYRNRYTLYRRTSEK